MATKTKFSPEIGNQSRGGGLKATLFTSSMAATEVQQPFKAAVDCVLNKLEGKFTLKIEHNK